MEINRGVAHHDGDELPSDPDKSVICIRVVTYRCDFADRLADWHPKASLITSARDAEQRVFSHDGHARQIVFDLGWAGLRRADWRG